MNTKLLMTSSAIIMGGAGVLLLFAPQETSDYLNSGSSATLDGMVLQILGALYFACAMTNWTAKSNLIGGIYGRPIAMGNMVHFGIGALALVKGNFTSYSLAILIFMFVYIVFAILFGIVVFRHPIKT